MNTDGCPTLWAKDQILNFAGAAAYGSESCTLLIPVWLVLISILTAMRTWVAFEHWRGWIMRRHKGSHSGGSGSNTGPKAATSSHWVPRLQLHGRWPLVPVFSTLVVIVQIVFLILVSLNIISSRDGLSALVAMAWFGSEHVVYYLFNMKIIHLGRKICPLKQHPAEMNAETASINYSLSHADLLQKVLLGIFFVTLPLGIISGGLTYLLQPNPNGEAFRGFLALNLFAVGSMVMSQVHQFGRVIRSVESQMAKVADLTKYSKSNGEVKRAIDRLKAQRIVMVSGGILMLSVVIVMAALDAMPWYLTLFVMTIETSTVLAMAISMNPRRRRKQPVVEGEVPVNTTVNSSTGMRSPNMSKKAVAVTSLQPSSTDQ